jgi:hypothetical protein
MTGWVGQALRWHWEYTRDREWLARRAYPYLAAAARFYYRYLEKYQDAPGGDVYPSMFGEGPGWNRGFEGNRNVPMDLGFFRKAFLWAIEASEVLGGDEEWRGRWRAGLKRLPAIAFGYDEGDPDGAWVSRRPWVGQGDGGLPGDWAGWLVFPGEFVDGDEPDGLAAAVRAIMQRDDPTHGRWDRHAIWHTLGGVRMQLPGAYNRARAMAVQNRLATGMTRTLSIGLLPTEWRTPEDAYFGVTVVTEMLLQSQGGVIRLFPGWPAGQSASFAKLRARGGFIVSAEWNAPISAGRAHVVSLHGETCRLRDNTASMPTVKDNGGRPVPVRPHGLRTYEFETVAKGEYTVSWNTAAPR